ncbi:peptide ABC transporter permease [Desulfosarcina ovata subsp. sediminis]|uniref:Peptide ABC transporter permease n=1 Tax=Desulfosarcina ovata subsp. sediminis TaxID=885957 RepID=A0A5K7ZRQ0_9BACT|nr:ABC transporter permease [Desulfosarcina ovata]BBO82393.1 peptide ABC transporter permease [Desulfosarcina ovata subsp. sediminis]
MNTADTISQQIPAAMPDQQKWMYILATRRGRTLLAIFSCLGLLTAILIWGVLVGETGLSTALSHRNQPPGWGHLFGTDWLGRDMLTRVLLGLRLSLSVGLVAALISTVLAMFLGLTAAMLGGVVDTVIIWLVDLFMSLPHLVFQILICFAVGGGVPGVILAVGITHWPGLTRIIRAEALHLKTNNYVLISAKLGHSRFWIARRHLFPHLVPQFLVGLILMFPHAILHEAGLSFIGIGLTPHMPSVGILLGESLRHLSTGYWWLAVIPGAALLIMVKSFDILGENIRTLLTPRTSQD